MDGCSALTHHEAILLLTDHHISFLLWLQHLFLIALSHVSSASSPQCSNIQTAVKFSHSFQFHLKLHYKTNMRLRKTIANAKNNYVRIIYQGKCN